MKIISSIMSLVSLIMVVYLCTFKSEITQKDIMSAIFWSVIYVGGRLDIMEKRRIS